jgi:hypothetical protein
MSIPNVGPEHPDAGDLDAVDSPRRGNPAPLLRDEPVTDDVSAASARATALTHRFGGVRYALSRPHADITESQPMAEEGDPNGHQ